MVNVVAIHVCAHVKIVMANFLYRSKLQRGLRVPWRAASVSYRTQYEPALCSGLAPQLQLLPDADEINSSVDEEHKHAQACQILSILHTAFYEYILN